MVLENVRLTYVVVLVVVVGVGAVVGRVRHQRVPVVEGPVCVGVGVAGVAIAQGGAIRQVVPAGG